MHRKSRGVLAALAVSLVAAIVPAAASADLPISALTAAPASTQAGAHSDFSLHMEFGGAEHAKGLVIHLPAGFIGDPSSATPCPVATFQARGCTAASAVGTSSVDGVATVLGLDHAITASGTVYVLQPGAGQTALLGIDLYPQGDGAVLSPHAILNQSLVTVRDTTDSGLDSTLTGLPETAETILGTATVHLTSLDLTLDAAADHGSFATNPTSCATATTTVDVTSYDSPGTSTRSASFTPTGCGDVPFTPTVETIPSTTKANANAGFTVKLKVPGGDTGGLRQSHVSGTVVTLPVGVGLNPGLAGGLVACTDAQFGKGSHDPASCPAGSQIGTVSLVTPVVGTIEGAVYLGQPTPEHLLRLFVVVNGPGFLVKLTGTNDLDPATGQVKATFSGLPQIPFTEFDLSFQGGDRSVLTTPPTCGPAVTSATLTPWSGTPPVTVTSSFDVSADGAGAACGATQPFAPTVAVSVDPTQAGAPTVNSVTMTRSDQDQLLSSATIDLPPGLAGSLKGVPFCPDADANAGTCSIDSRVGRVDAQAGVGPDPLSLTGNVYLAGPGDGALARLAIVLPGQVGPFDFGNVVSFAGLSIRPADAGLTVTTKNLPTTLQGIPLNLRQIKLTLDRPGFARNASSCNALSVHATFTSTQGATATADAPYQATGCDQEAFAPKIVASVASGVIKGARPAVTLSVVQPDGQAASKRVSVTLPSQINNQLLGTDRKACTIAQQAAVACPKESQIGTVTAETPLLPIPLTGPVYLAASKTGLPVLQLTLNPLGIVVIGQTSLSSKGQLVNTFDNLPDTPLTRFELKLNGGKSGILANTASLCTGKAPVATGAFVGQNGASATASATMAVTGCPPSAQAALRKLGTKQASLTLKVKRTRSGAKLTRVQLTMPKKMTVSKLTSKRYTISPKKGSKVRRKSTRVVVVTLPKGGAASVTLVLHRGGLKASKKVSKTLRVKTTDTAKKSVTAKITAAVKKKK